MRRGGGRAETFSTKPINSPFSYFEDNASVQRLPVWTHALGTRPMLQPAETRRRDGVPGAARSRCLCFYQASVFRSAHGRRRQFDLDLFHLFSLSPAAPESERPGSPHILGNSSSSSNRRRPQRRQQRRIPSILLLLLLPLLPPSFARPLLEAKLPPLPGARGEGPQRPGPRRVSARVQAERGDPRDQVHRGERSVGGGVRDGGAGSVLEGGGDGRRRKRRRRRRRRQGDTDPALAPARHGGEALVDARGRDALRLMIFCFVFPVKLKKEDGRKVPLLQTHFPRPLSSVLPPPFIFFFCRPRPSSDPSSPSSAPSAAPSKAP